MHTPSLIHFLPNLSRGVSIMDLPNVITTAITICIYSDLFTFIFAPSLCLRDDEKSLLVLRVDVLLLPTCHMFLRNRHTFTHSYAWNARWVLKTLFSFITRIRYPISIIIYCRDLSRNVYINFQILLTCKKLLTLLSKMRLHHKQSSITPNRFI